MYAWVRVRARIIAFSYTRVGVIHEYGNGNSGGRRDFAKTRGTSGVNENKKIKKIPRAHGKTSLETVPF